MKKILIYLLTMLCLLDITACRRQEKPTDDLTDTIAGNTYIYEGEGFGSDFYITLENDGTFTYSEGSLSSYIGMGEWTLDGETLSLSDDKESGFSLVNYFKADGEELVFLSENSSNFTCVTVPDEGKFTKGTIKE